MTAKKFTKYLSALLLILMPFVSTAADASQSHDKEAEEFDATELIQHHIADSHEFHLFDYNGHSYSMPLPVILWTNNGLVTFMSSEFDHNDDATVVVEKNGQAFVRYHGNIYYAAAFEAATDGSHIEAPAITDFSKRPMNFSITKHVFSLIFSVLLILVVFSAVARSYKKNSAAPKGIAGFLEPLIVFVRDEIAIPNIGAKKYEKFMPYLLTVFFIIWVNNLFGLIPFFPFSSNLTGNIAFTFVMAMFTFLITIFSGNKNYWGHIFNTPGVPLWLAPIMVPVEIMGMFTKPVALMIRLFANITAGHIIILSLVSLIFIFQSVFIAPVSGAFVLFMSALEILVAALQAYVFTLLSALFIGQAVEDNH
ncbi:F0F1 ATP synthase subunit A [Flavobacterium sp. NKUCC04_CG]|uniref:F0F1 ATP synthase subunit A n=1 Tax=Flavobacterium sp. NKUCC04_CG TaxID=2842121 RepID=UPI001C5AE3FB|nr:F0F1 ATP synthase subunit A [Flavobacterium sp. NKUCC04_CG]